MFPTVQSNKRASHALLPFYPILVTPFEIDKLHVSEKSSSKTIRYNRVSKTLSQWCPYPKILCLGANLPAFSSPQVGSKMSSLRTLQTGDQYSLPPPAAGLSPTDVRTLGEWTDVLSKVEQPTASKALVSFWSDVFFSCELSSQQSTLVFFFQLKVFTNAGV